MSRSSGEAVLSEKALLGSSVSDGETETYMNAYVSKQSRVCVCFGFGPLAMQENVRATVICQTTAAADRNSNCLGKVSCSLWFHFLCRCDFNRTRHEVEAPYTTGC